MRKLDEYPYKITVCDNGWHEANARGVFWHQGDIEKWAGDYFGLGRRWDQWTLAGRKPTTYYFMSEEDFVIFALKFGDSHDEIT
jgi:hypothetical protein